MPPPLKKYQGKRGDAFPGASVHSLDQNFFVKKGQIYAKPAHY